MEILSAMCSATVELSHRCLVITAEAAAFSVDLQLRQPSQLPAAGQNTGKAWGGGQTPLQKEGITPQLQRMEIIANTAAR